MGSAQQTVLITGANRGIGLSLCKEFIERKYTVFGSVRHESRDDPSVVELRKTGASVIEFDVTDENTIAAAFDSWGDKPLDILINNAGALTPHRMWYDVTAEALIDKFRVNAMGPFIVSKIFMPALEKSRSPKIINIASNSGQIAANKDGKYMAYKVSKTALNQVTMSLGMQMEMTKSKVIVVGIHPGWIPTKLTGMTGPDKMDVQIPKIVHTILSIGASQNGGFMDAEGKRMEF
ncbi:C-factor [Trichoderma lentiforme]|uniref:C-factor n=1 Tax=Trichoderma lentiforme TaxID=1567552 RepID=A0A9P4XD40_9HYPO|nr:C-factor [Trichoderma lentiforme]